MVERRIVSGNIRGAAIVAFPDALQTRTKNKLMFLAELDGIAGEIQVIILVPTALGRVRPFAVNGIEVVAYR